MDERDWRIAELESALKALIDMPVVNVTTGTGMFAAVNQREMLRIACKALTGEEIGCG